MMSRSTWRPRVIFFDLDDTLIHETATDDAAIVEVFSRNVSESSWKPSEIVTAVRVAARARWAQSGEGDYCRRIQTSSVEALYGDYAGDDSHLTALRAFVSGTSYREGVWVDVLRTLGIEDISLGNKLAVEFASERRARHVAFPDAGPVLARLAPSYRLGLITNGAPAIQRLKLAGSGFVGFFDPALILISGDLGIGKPDPAIFARALTQAGVVADEAVMVGNSLASDIVGARNSAIRAVWVDRTGEVLPSDLKPFQVIQSLSELLTGWGSGS
ncbi:MAG TPA: HAD family hydrolase [Chloroflexota bacterium]|nr:HAD family hydrolase [Chloroflexota bacterium]